MQYGRIGGEDVSTENARALPPKGSAPADRVRHLGVLGRLGLPIEPGGVICLSERALPMTDSVQVIPVAAL